MPDCPSESEKLFQALLRATPNPIAIKDLNGLFLACSESYGQVLGRQAAEIIGKAESELWPSEEADRLRQEDEQALTTGQVVTGLRIIETATGKRWCEVTKTPLLDEAGRAAGVLCTCLNITERRQVDSQRLMFRTLLDTSPDLLVFKDRQSAFLACSESLCQLTSRKMHEIIGRTDFDIWPLKDALTFRAEDLQVLETGRPLVVEHQMQAARGKRWLEAIKMPLRDEQDEIVGILYTERDITEHKAAAEALRLERDFIADVLDAVEAPVVVWNSMGRIMIFNRKSQEMFGYSEDEAVGRVIWDFFPPDEVNWMLRALAAASRHVGVPYHETYYLSKSGQPVSILWANCAQRDEESGETIFIGSGLDISERVAQEQQIRRSNRDLTILYASLRAASSSLDLEEVYARVADSLAKLGGYPVVTATARIGGSWKVCACLGYAPGLNPGPNAGIHGRVLRTGQPQFVPDVHLDPDFVATRDDVVSEICVPVMLEGEIAAILNIESTAERPLDEDDFRLMLALGDQMGLLVHNAKLHAHLEAERDEVRSVNEQLLAVQKASTGISSNRDVQALLNSIARSATELLNGDVSCILLMDAEGALKLSGTYVQRGKAAEEIRHRLDQSVSLLVAHRGKPLIVNDVASDRNLRRIVPSGGGVRSLISTPLTLGKTIIGTLNVHAEGRRKLFSEDDLQILSLLANQAAVALENVRLYAATTESEHRYRTLFESSLDGIVLVDATTGQIVEANQSFQDIVGYSLDELRRRKIWDLRPATQLEAARREWLEYVRRGTARGRGAPYLSHDGRYVEAEFSSRVVDLNGRLLDVTSVRDMTQTSQLEEQLRQAQKMEAIGALASGIAHDFNNILAAILGYTSFVKSTFGEDDERRSDLEVIERSVRQGAELTSQLLTFASGGSPQFRLLELNTVVDEVVQLLSRTVDKSIILRSELQPETSTVEGDRSQLQQMLLNLCLNACEAMPRGGFLTVQTVLVELDAERAFRGPVKEPGQYVMLSVSDTGHGMSHETIERVFEPFFSTKKDQPGAKHSGLGLSMVFGIVTGHKGFISAESELGSGTTFRIWLPAAAGTVVDAAPDTEGFDLAIQGGTETVLVVDDEEPIRELICRVLARVGYNPIAAADGVEALQFFRSRAREVDLVILDMVMPGVPGAQVFEEMLKIDSGVLVLVTSGFSEEGQVRDLLAHGARAFVHKPFDLSDLLRKVRIALEVNSPSD